MGDKSKIEWTDASWNPVTGCDPISEGCAHCYAKSIATRFAGTKAHPNGFKVTLHEERLHLPLKWKMPRRIFVNSMSDLFHDDVPDGFIDRVIDETWAASQHTFQILTKRPKRMHAYFRTRWQSLVTTFEDGKVKMRSVPVVADNVWLGVTAENNFRATERLPFLTLIPAVVRFVSVEPMLDRVDLRPWLSSDEGRINWVICGAETGPGKRPMNLDWARSLRDQCLAAKTAFFFKKDSAGNETLDGVEWRQFPNEGR